MARRGERCKREAVEAKRMKPTRRELLAGLGASLAAPAFAQSSDDLEVPFVPTPHSLVAKMLDLAAVQATDFLIDLGCGDGRIAVAAGRRGARALGVDLDALRIQEAGAAARVAGVEGRVRFRRQDLFATPIFEASVVALYLLPGVNLRLRARLLTELAAGARIVSHAFDMGDWRADVTEEHEGRRIFLWHVPAVAGGSWELTGSDGGYRLLELEQRFQEVSGTISGGGSVQPISGRLQGPRLSMVAEGGALRLDGQVRGDEIVPVEGAAWRLSRLA
jgi:SAM-dependent methyltransferase